MQVEESYVIIPAFSLEKRVYKFHTKVGPSSVRLSVRACVRVYVRALERASVTFLANVSPPKPLDLATSNFVIR